MEEVEEREGECGLRQQEGGWEPSLAEKLNPTRNAADRMGTSTIDDVDIVDAGDVEYEHVAGFFNPNWTLFAVGMAKLHEQPN